MLTRARSRDDVDQIVYGYELRGITVEPRPSLTKGWEIILISGDETVAKASLERIWDAVLEGTPRATDKHGACFFCGYDVTTLTPPVTCPECGRSIDTIAARRAARDGAMPRPEDTRGV